MARLAPRRDGERGAVAVEFAILLPLLVLILFGIIEFGIFFNHKQGLQAAAREGARLASLPTTTSGQVSTRVMDSLSGTGIDTSKVNVSVTGGGTPCASPNTQVTVTVTAPETVNIPFWADRTYTLTGKGVFKCEN